MKVSQIKTFHSMERVNEWLKINHHLEIVNITVSRYAYNCDLYLVHFKLSAELK